MAQFENATQIKDKENRGVPCGVVSFFFPAPPNLWTWCVVRENLESRMNKQQMNSLILCSKETGLRQGDFKSVLLLEAVTLHWYSPTAKEKWKRSKGRSNISLFASSEVDFLPVACPVPILPLQVKDCDKQIMPTSWDSFSEETLVIVSPGMVNRLLKLLGYLTNFFLWKKNCFGVWQALVQLLQFF